MPRFISFLWPDKVKVFIISKAMTLPLVVRVFTKRDRAKPPVCWGMRHLLTERESLWPLKITLLNLLEKGRVNFLPCKWDNAFSYLSCYEKGRVTNRFTFSFWPLTTNDIPVLAYFWFLATSCFCTLISFIVVPKRFQFFFSNFAKMHPSCL